MIRNLREIANLYRSIFALWVIEQLWWIAPPAERALYVEATYLVAKAQLNGAPDLPVTAWVRK